MMLRPGTIRGIRPNAVLAVDRHALGLLRPSMTCIRLQHDDAQSQPQPQQQPRQAHAVANPKLAHIEKRWETMPPPEQAELWMALRDRMKSDWRELTWQEKKTAWWIAFGPHGPRAEDPPGEGWKIFGGTMLGCGIAFVLFVLIRMFAKEPPKTMTREWQEMTNEYMKQQNMEPITGISSEGYKGKGAIQSGPAAKLQNKDS